MKLKILNNDDPRFSRRMRILIAIILLACVNISQPVAAEPSATEIIRRMENILRGETARSRMLIIVKRPRFTRKILLDSWDRNSGKKNFMRILAPKKDRGIAFLKRGTDLWQYIPKIGKEIKIEGSLMHDSWMGSDFTNDDLVKASSIIDDYTHTLGTASEPDTYFITLTPKPGAPVVWGKIESVVRKKDYLPVYQLYFDHRGRQKKRMEYYDIKRMGGKILPTRMEMYSIKHGKKTSSTILIFKKLQFDVNIPEHIFSKSNLRR